MQPGSAAGAAQQQAAPQVPPKGTPEEAPSGVQTCTMGASAGSVLRSCVLQDELLMHVHQSAPSP